MQGLYGDQFVTPIDGVSFNNFSGNRAFFDANNFLTKPAALISSSAWWTDPKETDNGVVDGSSYLSIGFFNSPLGYAQILEFDAAMVRIDTDVPTSLPFTARDTLNNEVNGLLDFTGFGAYVVDAGTFFSANSPRVGREAQFEFYADDLFSAYIGGDPTVDYDDATQYGIKSFAIQLNSIATFGGTSQFALDNLTFGGDAFPDTGRETMFVTAPGPLGPNTPQYFAFASGVSGVPVDAAPGSVIGLHVETEPVTPGVPKELINWYAEWDQADANLDRLQVAFGEANSVLSNLNAATELNLIAQEEAVSFLGGFHNVSLQEALNSNGDPVTQLVAVTTELRDPNSELFQQLTAGLMAIQSEQSIGPDVPGGDSIYNLVRLLESQNQAVIDAIQNLGTLR